MASDVHRTFTPSAIRKLKSGRYNVFARAKSNLGPSGGGFQYSLEQVRVEAADCEASRVLWAEPVTGDARTLLAAAETADDPEERDALDDAKSWLVATLADAGGSMGRRELMNAAKTARFPERTIYRARTKAGIQARTDGFGPNKRSVWTLPLVVASNFANDPNIANVANPERLAGMAKMERQGAEGCRRWRVTRATGETFTTTTVHPMTAAEMQAQYPGAMVEYLDEATA